MPIHILRILAVCSRTGLGRSTIYAFEKQGRFPKRIRLSSRSVGWNEKDVEAWLAERTTH